MVSGRHGPCWLDDDDGSSPRSPDRGRSHPRRFHLDAGTDGPGDASRPLVERRHRRRTALAVATRGPATRRDRWLGTDGARAMELSTVAGRRPAADPDARRTTIGLGVAAAASTPVETRLVQAPGAGGPIESGSRRRRTPADGPLADGRRRPRRPARRVGPGAPHRGHPPRRRRLPGRPPEHPRLGDVRPRLDPAAARRLGRRRCRRRPRRARPRHRARPRRPGPPRRARPELRRVHGQLAGRDDRSLQGGGLGERRHQPDQRLGQLRLRPGVRPGVAARRPASAPRASTSSGASRRCATSRTSRRRC